MSTKISACYVAVKLIISNYFIETYKSFTIIIDDTRVELYTKFTQFVTGGVYLFTFVPSIKIKKFMNMVDGFEPQTSVVGSNSSANCAAH